MDNQFWAKAHHGKAGRIEVSENKGKLFGKNTQTEGGNLIVVDVKGKLEENIFVSQPECCTNVDKCSLATFRGAPGTGYWVLINDATGD